MRRPGKAHMSRWNGEKVKAVFGGRGFYIALAFCLSQKYFRWIKLDPANYYLDAVPIYFNVGLWLLLNVATLIISVAILIGPSYLISRIHPAKSIRFE